MNYIEQFMKDNDIKINEEFYVIDENGKKIGGLISIIFYFDKNMRLNMKLVESDCRDVLRGLMLGECKIEKIPQKPKTVWDLTEEDMYYCIHNGDISQYLFDSDTDKDIRDLGNAFLTREEAELEVERRKCEAILLKYGTRDIRSLDDDTNKYYIIFDNSVDKIIFPCCNYMQNQGTIYFESKELALKAIEEVGEERLKKYIFNVKVPEFLNKKMNLKE